MAPLRMALLGAGIFASDTYTPILSKMTGSIELVAVWSRTQEHAEGLVKDINKFSPGARAYFGEDGLNQLLSSTNVEAMTLVLPIQDIMPIAKRALAAGKHVLQEKPVSDSAQAAAASLAEFRAAQAALAPEKRVEWCLAENWRHEDGFHAAAKWLAGKDGGVGEVLKMDLVVEFPMEEGNRFYDSEWRRETCPGGFIADFMVHFIAATRQLAHAAGLGEFVSAMAVTEHHNPGLPPSDTLAAVLRCAPREERGGPGCATAVSVTFACCQMRCSLSVTGRDGTLEVLRGGWDSDQEPPAWRVSYRRRGDDAAKTSPGKHYPLCGVERELESFAEVASKRVALAKAALAGEDGATEGGSAAAAAAAESPVDPEQEALLRPEEGIQDLAVVEALLLSASRDGALVPIHIVQDDSKLAEAQL